MKAVGYFREPARGGASLAEQNKAFLEFCGREGFEIAGTFADDGIANGHAFGFRQLVTFLRTNGSAPGSATVVVSDVHTLGHDLRDAAVRMFQLEGLGARVTPLRGGVDAEDALMAAWTSDAENDRLSDRVRVAMRKRALKGEVLGRPPYGYKVGTRRRLEPVPEEAVVVRYIFRLYLQENMGIRLIARRLNEESIKTRRGGNWSMVSVRDILRNRAYLGTYARFNVRVSGTHQSLVSPDDYHAVQERLDARRTSHTPRVASQFVLSGLAYCGYCSNKLIGVSRKQSWKRQDGEKVSNSYRYYQCESRTNQSICGYHTRRADDLEVLVRDGIEQLLSVAQSPPPVVDASAALAEQQTECVRLRSRLRALDRRLERCVDDAARGRITRATMHSLGIETAADRLSTEDSLEGIEQQAGDRVGRAEQQAGRGESMRSLIKNWDTTSFEQRQSVLRRAVLRVDVSDDAVKVALRP